MSRYLATKKKPYNNYLQKYKIKRVVPRRTVVGDIDRRFDNLSGSHHQSHVNCGSSVYGIYVSGQLSRYVIGCFKSNRWLGRDVIGCWFVKSCCYLL